VRVLIVSHDHTAFAANAALIKPTFHAVHLSLNLLGLGIEPVFTPRQIVALDTPYKAFNTGKRINALSGIESKLINAGGMF
jgi:hypothetical protein